VLVEVHGAERAGPFYEHMGRWGYRFWTPDGTEVVGGSYHHHLVCVAGG
jgi:hypothetical protein